MSNPYDEALLEIENLKAQIQQWKTSSLLTPIDMLAFFNLKSENERLQAEVERLKRAGDLMLKFASANMPYPPYATMAKDWLFAKEGNL